MAYYYNDDSIFDDSPYGSENPWFNNNKSIEYKGEKIFTEINGEEQIPGKWNAKIAMKILSLIRNLPDGDIPNEEEKILREIIKFFIQNGEIPMKYFGGYGREIPDRDVAYLLEPKSEKIIHLLAVDFYDYENWRIIISVVQNYIRYHYLNDKSVHKICNFGAKCNKKNSCKFIHA